MRSAFLDTIGESPVFKVLDFLTVNDDFDYSMRDIARFAGIGYTTLKLFWPRLEKENIVVLTRKVGKAKLYKLNDVNPAVQRFKEFYWELAKQAIPHKVQRTEIAFT